MNSSPNSPGRRRFLQTAATGALLGPYALSLSGQTAVAGVLTGSIYGLMCVGLALIFGVMRVINFAQGDFMMLGMYAAYYLFGLLGIQTVFGNVLG
ncbi:MAG: branched-chain amino acid ABC transporter permease, partial [Verrucomicrobiota bacterium]